MGSKNFGSKIIWGRKNWAPKKFWVQKNQGPNKICLKFLSQKRFLYKIIGGKNVGWKKIGLRNFKSGSSIFLVEKIWAKNILGCKKCWVKKNFGFKKIWV